MPSSLQSLVRWLREATTSPGVGGVLARGAGTSMAVRATGVAVAFGVQVLLARLLGAGEYGIYAYALSWLNLLALASALGFDGAAVRFVAQYKAGEEIGQLWRFLIAGSRTVIWASLTLAAVAIGVVFAMRGRLDAGALTCFVLAFATLPWIAQLQFRSAALRSLKHIAASQIPLDLVRPILVAVPLILAYGVLPMVPTASIAMGFTLVANVVAMVVASLWLRRSLPPKMTSDSGRASLDRVWLRLGFTMLALSGFNLLLAQTDILMVGAMISTKTAGFYSAATRIARLVSFGLAAVSSISAPMIAEYYAVDRRRELRRLLRLAAWCLIGFAVPASIFMVLFGRSLLGMFGAEFEVAYRPLLVLTLAQLTGSLAGPVGFLMTMTGHEVQAAWILGPTAMINIVLNVVLIPIYGISGAAIATAVSAVAWNTAMVFFVKRRLKVNPMAFGG